jgi:hypothetical protein
MTRVPEFTSPSGDVGPCLFAASGDYHPETGRASALPCKFESESGERCHALCRSDIWMISLHRNGTLQPA